MSNFLQHKKIMLYNQMAVLRCLMEHERVSKYLQSITGQDTHLVLEFFITFSRFEYALKQAGFVKCDGYKNVSADWDDFAEEVLQAKLANTARQEFEEACSYLIQNPPKKQKKEGKRMQWKPNLKRPEEGEAQYLLRLVRDVRNNLFHGGKYPDGPVEDMALRNSTLLRNCLTVLAECRSLDAHINSLFEEVP